MLSEAFITSVRAQPKSANIGIAKDVGIYVHELHPAPGIKSSFKKSSTPVNALAANSTHIFAAQADKAVVHIYSRERGNQEALISFPEKIHSLSLVGEGVLVLGTAEGRAILWEVYTGRQISTPTAHLQPITCLVATHSHLITGSEDSNIHVWSLPRLLSISSNKAGEPLRTLSNHRAAVTSLALGHSSSGINICVSGSQDDTVLVWNYQSGDLLRTFLLPSTPLCLALDPCDRAVYIGFEDGSVQLVEFTNSDSTEHPLFDTRLQATPVQITAPSWSTQSDEGPALCISVSYDGTNILSGHRSGKIILWDSGRHCFSAEVADVNAPVTNVVMMSPFPKKKLTKATAVVKPKLGSGNYTFTGQLTGSIGGLPFDRVVDLQGYPLHMLESAVASFLSPAFPSSSNGDDELKQENVELWKILNEQRTLQKKTWAKYTSLKSRGA